MSALRDLLEVGQEALAIGLENVTVEVKTNYGPAIRIPTSGSGETGGFISDAIGFRAGVIVRNSRGDIVETIGDPAPTDPVRFAALVGLAGVASFVILRGVLKK